LRDIINTYHKVNYFLNGTYGTYLKEPQQHLQLGTIRKQLKSHVVEPLCWKTKEYERFTVVE